MTLVAGSVDAGRILLLTSSKICTADKGSNNNSSNSNSNSNSNKQVVDKDNRDVIRSVTRSGAGSEEEASLTMTSEADSEVSAVDLVEEA